MFSAIYLYITLKHKQPRDLRSRFFEEDRSTILLAQNISNTNMCRSVAISELSLSENSNKNFNNLLINFSVLQQAKFASFLTGERGEAAKIFIVSLFQIELKVFFSVKWSERILLWDY